MSEPLEQSTAELLARAEAAEQEVVWLKSSGRRLAKELVARLDRELEARRQAERRLRATLSSRTWAVGRVVVWVPRRLVVVGRRGRALAATRRRGGA